MTKRTILRDKPGKTYPVDSRLFKEARLAKNLSLRQCAAELSKYTSKQIWHQRLYDAELLSVFGVDEEVWQAIRKVLNV